MEVKLQLILSNSQIVETNMINMLNYINESMLGVLNALFTLIGFAVTIYTFKRSLKNELIKTQNSITLDQVRDLLMKY